MHRDVTPTVHSKNIFIVETTCNPQSLYRNWCSVESWASQHPDKELWYILTSPFISDTTGIMKSLLDQYPNIRVVSSKFREIFQETPLWDLFNSDKWLKDTAWPESNLSNMVRGALVWKWGGVYADTDTICIRSTTKFTNSVGLVVDGSINVAVLIGQPHHQAFWMLMEHIKENFKGNVWGHNGPKAITSVMTKLCKGGSFHEIANNEQGCQNMSLLTAKHFYPIPFRQRQTYMLERKETDLEKPWHQNDSGRVNESENVMGAAKNIKDTESSSLCRPDKQTRNFLRVL
ncbi:lactosylceramide 4-alpha-galactosyltransferase-like isoform X2 [Macrobrachium rosenbergii]|uniref:lactosylceramide 4-alpha-galactosyltransferase-like isoform X2 n=1 Tax=Macrobrachium rosenbergii TaxID=79674 RepID=UPI0034D7A16D